MSKPAKHPAGERTGKRDRERREDHQEGDGPETVPRAAAGGGEEE